MAVPVVTLTASTPDGDPTNAPYRVSHDPAKDDLSFSWSIAFGGVLRYWQERFNATTRLNGKRRRSLGVVCGMTRIGAPGAKLLGATSSPQVSSDTYSDIDSDMLAGEGAYRFQVDALNDDGWSA